MRTYFVFGVFLLGATLSCALETKPWIDYRLANLGRSVFGPRVARQCTGNGYVCDTDCTKLYVCSDKDGNGVYEPSLAKTCGPDTVCNSVAKDCTETPSVECTAAGRNLFVCKDEGFFPDPIDCQQYHICTYADEAMTTFNDVLTRRCAGTWQYNPRTSYCDLAAKCAGFPVPECKQPGQSEALKANPSLFYQCLEYIEGNDENESENGVLYPYMYLCPNGKTWNPLTGQCK